MKKILIVLIVGYLGMDYANSTDLEQEVYEEEQENQFEENYIRSLISFDKAIKAGQETLQSLKSNLKFTEKLENDPKFVECVILKANLKRMDELGKDAKRLFDKNKISKQDYNRFISELDNSKVEIKNKINSSCNKEKQWKR